MIIRGGDRFVDAAVWMASASRIPPFVIGATVVSLATTLPEMLVSVMASLSGQADMATGNAIGSVTANTALILAVSIVFMPGPIDRSRYLPKVLLLMAAVALLWVTGLSGSVNVFGCIGMFILFGVYLYENLHSARIERRGEETEQINTDRKTVVKNILVFIVGAAEIILGSRLLVDNGTLIARDVLHIDERIISLTMVAVGTSLPELVTAISAVIKRNASLTAGNILGANILDTLLILPVCAVANGGSLPLSNSTLWIDIPFCMLVIALTMIPALIKKRFTRAAGLAALAAYAVYCAGLFTSGWK